MRVARYLSSVIALTVLCGLSVPAIASADYSSSVIADGPLAYYHLDEADGQPLAADSSGSIPPADGSYAATGVALLSRRAVPTHGKRHGGSPHERHGRRLGVRRRSQRVSVDQSVGAGRADLPRARRLGRRRVEHRHRAQQHPARRQAQALLRVARSVGQLKDCPGERHLEHGLRDLGRREGQLLRERRGDHQGDQHPGGLDRARSCSRPDAHRRAGRRARWHLVRRSGDLPRDAQQGSTRRPLRHHAAARGRLHPCAFAADRCSRGRHPQSYAGDVLGRRRAEPAVAAVRRQCRLYGHRGRDRNRLHTDGRRCRLLRCRSRRPPRM